MTFLEAIAHEEGFYSHKLPTARPIRNNNPGDLEFGPEASEFGATHGDPRFAVFPDLDTGWKALRRWLSIPAKFNPAGDLTSGYCGASIEKVIKRFAPPSENATGSYINNVCLYTGLNHTDILTKEILDEAYPNEPTQ